MGTPYVDIINPASVADFRERLGVGPNVLYYDLWKAQISEINSNGTFNIGGGTVPITWDEIPIPLPDGTLSYTGGTMPTGPHQLPAPAKQTYLYTAPSIPIGSGGVTEAGVTDVIDSLVNNGASGGVFDGTGLSEGQYTTCDPILVDTLKRRNWTVILPHHPSYGGYVALPNDGSSSITGSESVSYYLSDASGNAVENGNYISASRYDVLYPAIIDLVIEDPNIMDYPYPDGLDPVPIASLGGIFSIYIMKYHHGGGMHMNYMLSAFV